MNDLAQKELDQKNAAFWDELCGTGFAQHLGIKDHSEESLRKFDDAYFQFYPYLLEHIRPELMRGQKVLEIGLGYGTVGQRIFEEGTEYFGLDIAESPVKMMNYRSHMKRLPEKAQQGSMLACPFEAKMFDHVVSIGCFHHTGDIQKCFDETHRILKPGGRAMIMVYNKYSYRQWYKNFWPTLCASFSSKREVGTALSKKNRKDYDTNKAGEGAPEVVLSSIKELKDMLKKFRRVSFQKENFNNYGYINKVIDRKHFLNTLGKVVGLDIYIECYK